MRYKLIPICLIFILSFLSNSVSASAIPRVAIIGGGIGGTSCAYFLRKLFGNNIHLDVYEAEDVGGRLSVVPFGGRNYEVGGSIIHSRNKYMTDFLKLFRLKKREESSDSYFGIYDGQNFVFEESKWQIITLLKLIARYHFGFWRLRNHISKMLDNFEKIYQYQDEGITFENVTSLLLAMDPKFVDYLQISSEKGFLKEGFSDNVVHELIMATIRTNYGQDLNIHKFVGSVSVAGASGGLWAFDGGNAKVPEKLLQLSEVNLIKSMVTKIKKLTSSGMEIASQVEGNSDNKEIHVYDIVVIAAPQTSDMKHRISFENFEREINFPGKYHQTVCTLVQGKLKETYFPNKNKWIDAVLSVNNSVIFNSIGRIYPVDYKRKNSKVSNVWKIFSQRLLTDKELSSLFSEVNEKYVKVWLAYPEYDTSQRRDSFVLDDNLYHINAIDWAASSIEMSVIGAKNVALLAYQNWKKREIFPRIVSKPGSCDDIADDFFLNNFPSISAFGTFSLTPAVSLDYVIVYREEMSLLWRKLALISVEHTFLINCADNIYKF